MGGFAITVSHTACISMLTRDKKQTDNYRNSNLASNISDTGYMRSDFT